MTNDYDLLRNAVLSSLKDIITSTTKEDIVSFVNVLKTLREDIIIPLTTTTVLISNVWTPIRKNQALLNDIFTGTTIFRLHFNDLESIIQNTATRILPFSKTTTLVDREVISKRMSSAELTTMLSDNVWLFYLIVSSWFIKDINDLVIKTHIPAPKV